MTTMIGSVPRLRAATRAIGPRALGRSAIGRLLRCFPGGRRASGSGRRGRGAREAEPDVAQLMLEPAVRDLSARIVVERRGMQRVRDPVDDRRAQLVAVG